MSQSSAGPHAVTGSVIAEFPELLARARSGSGRALRALYDALSPQVAGYLRLRGANDVDAATNEVFYRAFDRLNRFSGSASGFRSWVFTIAHNLLIDEHRKQMRRPNVVASIDPASDQIPGGDVEAEALGNLVRHDIDELLTTLTPSQRDVLHLRLIAGLTLAETADVLGRPLGAVKSLQHRGVEALKAAAQRGTVPRDAIGTF